MRFVISFLLVASVHAAPIKVFYEDDSTHAVKVRETLMEEYKIPVDLIELSKVFDCEGLARNGKLDLCLKNNGDLILVSVDRGFVNESLKIFRAP